MFRDRSEVVRELVRIVDVFDPATGSLLRVGQGGTHGWGEPFRAGFITGWERREELLRRLRRLDARKQTILCYWYLGSLSAADIAKKVNVSRTHCYRLRNQALRELEDAETPDVPQVIHGEDEQPLVASRGASGVENL